MKRDVQLDAYRAMLMIYIVCFIHVEFWLEYGKEPMMSLSLVEMPLIFFVSGAALSYRREPRPKSLLGRDLHRSMWSMQTVEP